MDSTVTSAPTATVASLVILKIAIIVGVLLLATAAVYVYRRQQKKQTKKEESKPFGRRDKK